MITITSLLLSLLAMSSHVTAPVTTRTVFVSVVDKAGQFISGLTPGDFVVKEGGQRRDVISVEPAGGTTRIVLLFEELLTRDTDSKLAVIRLIQRLQGRAEMSVVVAGMSNTTVVPFTADGAAVVVGINELARRPGSAYGHIVEGILDAARDLGGRPADRRIVIALTVDRAELVSVQPDEVFTALRNTGTSLYAIALRGPSEVPSLDTMIDAGARSQVLHDGSTQSGGRVAVLTQTTGFPAAMISIAEEILHQHKLVYQLPDGVKRDTRLSVSIARPGLTVRAPTRVSAEIR
jgi:hypothetical protein